MVERSSDMMQVKNTVFQRSQRSEPRAGELRVPSPWLVLWWLIFIFLIAAGLIGANALIFFSGWAKPGQELPIRLLSPLQANYGVDPIGARLPPVEMRIIQDAFADRAALEDGQPDDQMATIVAGLLTPVPSVTLNAPAMPGQEPSPAYNMGETDAATSLPQRTGTAARTPTQFEGSPTYTALPSATVTLRATSTPLRTYPPTAVPTEAANFPTVSPSKTPAPTLPASTSTQPPKPPVQPTATRKSEVTAAPQPTDIIVIVPTAVAPTAVPYPAPADPIPEPVDPYPVP